MSSNVIAVLRDGVENLVELARDKQSIQDDIKEFKKEMKGRKLPVDHLLKLAKQSPEDRQKDREGEAQARALLGLPQIADGAVATVEDESLAKLAQTRVKDILGLEDEKRSVADQEKEVYTSLKEAGFAVPVVRKLVQFRLDPEKYDNFTEMSGLLGKYMEALDDA